MLLKEKQRILKWKGEQLKMLTSTELHAQGDPQSYPNNSAPGRTRSQSDTSMAKIPMANRLAQQSTKEPKTIRKKSKKELHEWIQILDSYLHLELV